MKKPLTRIAVYLLLVLLGVSGMVSPGWAGGPAPVVIIPVTGTIEPGLAQFVTGSLADAERSGARRVIMEIDTPGGLIVSAQEIKSAILNSRIPVTALVAGEAKSAGVLITLAANEVAMIPGSTIGAAEPVPNNEKVLSSWRADLAEVAEVRGKNPQVVMAMADKSIEIPGVKEKGKLLTLTSKKAKELGLADMLVQDRNQLLKELSQRDGVDYQAQEVKTHWAQRAAWLIVNPFVSPLLLLIGFAGLIIESFTLGWGVAGTVGFVALGLFFGGHIMAGISGWEALLVFILGVLAIMLEIFVIPGFGAAGVIGIGLIIWSIFLASVSYTQAIISVTVALVGSIVLLGLALKYLGKRGLWNRLVLGVKQDKETGYIAPRSDLQQFMGQNGRTLTPLRPAGAAEITGQRVDVVTEGDFVPANVPVQVVLVEGTRVVVRQIAGE
ncbi:MAG: NfeD family protein [Bacillota bacterium]